MAEQKTMKAPGWFLELERDRQVKVDDLVSALGISKEWMEQNSWAKVISLADEKHANGSFNRLERARVGWLIKFLVNLGEYRWAKFRLENWENTFGIAPSLRFHEDTNYISIRQSPIEVAKREMTKAMERVKKVFGGEYKVEDEQ